MIFFFFKQKTAYEMRISDWSSDVCSSDLQHGQPGTFQSDGQAARIGNVGGIDQRQYFDQQGTRPFLGGHDAGTRYILLVLRQEQGRRIRSEERPVGKSVSVRVDLGGRRIFKKKTKSIFIHLFF